MNFSDFGELVKNNLDAAGNRDCYDGAEKAHHVGADSDGDEDDKGREIEGIALDFGFEDVGFDDAIDGVVNNPEDGSEGVVEEKEKSDSDAADELAEHWNNTADHSNHAHRESEVVF